MTLAAAGVYSFGQTAAVPGKNELLSRRYSDGQNVRYKMTGRNQNGDDVRTYTAIASGAAVKQGSGVFVDEVRWSDLVWNGRAEALSDPDKAMRERLSFDPGYTLTIPDLSKVNPKLIGPITDLLTFYVDLQLASQMVGLTHPGDHVFFKHGTANSWADGQYFLIAQDAVDFDFTLKSIDTEKKTAVLLVRHLPPVDVNVKLPAAWMKVPVGSSQNNWVEVAKQAETNFDVQVGMETFDVVMTVSTVDGALLSAHMENPVEVLERHCKDAALTDCSEGKRFRILRQISIE